jgi:hypothetical protein
LGNRGITVGKRLGKPENLSLKGQFKNKKLASEAGKKSATVQSEMREARKMYEYCLSLKAPEQIEQTLKKHLPDIEHEKIDMLKAICLRTVIEAGNGNIQAIKEVFDRAFGQAKSQQDVNLTGNIDISSARQSILEDLEQAKADKEAKDKVKREKKR